MPTSPPLHPDLRLHDAVAALARRIRGRHLNAAAAQVWAVAVAGGILLYVIGQGVPALAGLVAPLWIVGLVIALVVLARRRRRTPLDAAAAASAVEGAYPDLDNALRTALEQRPGPDGRWTFLQRRVIDVALRHAARHDWRRLRVAGARLAGCSHAAALVAVLAVSILVVRPVERTSGDPSRAAVLLDGVEVTPGTVEVERGTTVVIAARFGQVPEAATLVWSRPGEAPQRTPMGRSLSDPVFAHTLPTLGSEVTYWVEHDAGRTPEYRVTVFDRPALLRADAALEYPAYTGLDPRRVEDTRRVSAVEGTRLAYEFSLNKPVRSAVLRSADGAEIALTPIDPEGTRFRWDLTVAESRRLTLHLEDEAGRTNTPPPDLRIEALPNRRPDLKLLFPVGDRRVSAVEEVTLRGEARDDFGLLDYGVGVVTGGGEPEWVTLRPATPKVSAAAAAPDAPGANPAQRLANFDHALDLEARGVAVDALVSWFVWADDFGPDGAPRRTTSDLFFAEVRPFDEVFREDPAGASQPPGGGGGGGPAGDLLERQREITLAIWKLRQDRAAPAWGDDVKLLVATQATARGELAALAPRLRQERQREAAAQADRHMGAAGERLERAVADTAPSPLDAAWTEARSAYEALLRLQPRDTNVAQGQPGQGGGGGGARQRQLDQLRFRDDENPYATQSQAQALASPEERAELEVLARLRALAQRQQDVNERLRDLQTALAAANDEVERERLRRELRRLEDEQRQMIADLDATRQRLEQQPPGEQTRAAREQLEQTRDDMRRASESLEKGEVSQALAAGSRARESLESTRDDLRRETSSRFAEELREARRAARDLAERQAESERRLEAWETEGPRALDDSAARTALAADLDGQREALDGLVNRLREVTEAAEVAEPRLHRQLYDLLRQQGQRATGDNLQAGAELLRRGFVDRSRDAQPEVRRDLEALRGAVERAAESVLGDEAATLRFAESELAELGERLAQEQSPAASGASPGEATAGETGAPGQGPAGESPGSPSGQAAQTPGASGASGAPGESGPGAAGGEAVAGEPGQGTGTGPGQSTAAAGAEAGAGAGGDSAAGDTGGGGSGGGSLADLTRALSELAAESGGPAGRGGLGGGPISSAGYGEWMERLRTVESLVESPAIRDRLSEAREQAEALRADYRRGGQPPRWDLIEGGVGVPLAEARAWLRQELARRDDPAALQPVDRDPVPERYSEAVQRYYEALGR